MHTMRLGSFTQRMLSEARWKGTREEDFPSDQVWADDIESVLRFLEDQNQIERFWPQRSRCGQGR